MDELCRDTIKFQSTLSMRRATHQLPGQPRGRSISIHALHEESDAPRRRSSRIIHAISIHALHEESDLETGFIILGITISIHALHEESDFPNVSPSTRHCYFNPRSP